MTPLPPVSVPGDRGEPFLSHPYDAPGDAPATALRRSFERARLLSLENQIEECVDQLQNPGLLAAEVLDAYRVMESCFASEQPPSLAERSRIRRRPRIRGCLRSSRNSSGRPAS